MIETAATIFLVILAFILSIVLTGYIVGTIRASIDSRPNDESDTS